MSAFIAMIIAALGPIIKQVVTLGGEWILAWIQSHLSATGAKLGLPADSPLTSEQHGQLFDQAIADTRPRQRGRRLLLRWLKKNTNSSSFSFSNAQKDELRDHVGEASED